MGPAASRRSRRSGRKRPRAATIPISIPKDRSLFSKTGAETSAQSQLAALLKTTLARDSLSARGNPTLAADNNRLFALYNAINRLDTIAKMANRDETLSGLRPGLDGDYQDGLDQVMEFLKDAEFSNLAVLTGKKTSSITGTGTIAYAKLNYISGAAGEERRCVRAAARRERLRHLHGLRHQGRRHHQRRHRPRRRHRRAHARQHQRARQRRARSRRLRHALQARADGRRSHRRHRHLGHRDQDRGRRGHFAVLAAGDARRLCRGIDRQRRQSAGPPDQAHRSRRHTHKPVLRQHQTGRGHRGSESGRHRCGRQRLCHRQQHGQLRLGDQSGERGRVPHQIRFRRQCAVDEALGQCRHRGRLFACGRSGERRRCRRGFGHRRSQADRHRRRHG